jgi:hypothetical protein
MFFKAEVISLNFSSSYANTSKKKKKSNISPSNSRCAEMQHTFQMHLYSHYETNGCLVCVNNMIDLF